MEHWLLPYNSQTLSCTAEIDISLKNSWNGGWHRLGCYPIRSSFHRKKCGKRDMQSVLGSVFHVFNGGKRNGLEIKPAYVTRLFETRLTTYCSLLYVKMDARYKLKTKAFHFPRGPFSAYISRPFSRTATNDISLDASWKGEWHRLDCHPICSSFHRWKRDIWSFLCSVFHVF